MKLLLSFFAFFLFSIFFFQCKKKKQFSSSTSFQKKNSSSQNISHNVVKIYFQKEREKKIILVDKTETTVNNFSNFIKATGYITEAEKFGDSIVFLNREWQLLKKANWKYPLGIEGEKSYRAKGNHPVVHVSYNDALAYAKFVKKRLPTEEEWLAISKYSAEKKSTQNKRYPWGNFIKKKNQYFLNIWQGEFPIKNTAKDGFLYTSPVGFFKESNLLEIADIGGNVWEICDSDASIPKKKIIKGGSFMCHESYCQGYDPQQKMSVFPNESYFHIGFRLVKDFIND